MRGTSLKLLGALTAVAIVTAACGSKDKTTSATTDATTATTAAAQAAAGHDMGAMSTADTSGAAQLRASLTSMLQEHVFLAGITTGTALAGQDFKPAAAALDANTQDLQNAITSVYGDAGGKQFGDLWRKHIGFFVDYTTAKATNDEAKLAKAKADLDGYRADFGAFIESATKGALTKQAVADELTPHVQTLEAAIDAQAAKSPDAVDKLKTAADHMPMTADILAGAIVKQFPDKFSGSVDSPASTLRATLTADLQEHVYLAAITTGTALAGQDFKPAATVLDKNTQQLQDAVASVYGDAGGKQFGDLWRKHIGFFVDYTTAKATNDQAKLTKAQADLDGYRADFGAFIDAATKGALTKQAVADDLTGHVQSLEAAIDAQAAKDPGQFTKLKAAAAHMPMTAQVLAGAIVKQFPDKFAA